MSRRAVPADVTGEGPTWATRGGCTLSRNEPVAPAHLLVAIVDLNHFTIQR